MECEGENGSNGRRRLKIRIGDVFGGINFLLGCGGKGKFSTTILGMRG